MKSYSSKYALWVLALWLCLSGGPKAHGQETTPAAPKTAPNTSVLTVFAQNGEPFFLVLDGERKNSKPSARVTVPNLDRPFYKAKVIFDDDRLGSLDASIQMEGVEAKYNDVTYQIKKKKKKDKMIYSLVGYSYIPLGGISKVQEMENDNNQGSNTQPATDTPGQVIAPNPSGQPPAHTSPTYPGMETMPGTTVTIEQPGMPTQTITTPTVTFNPGGQPVQGQGTTPPKPEEGTLVTPPHPAPEIKPMAEDIFARNLANIKGQSFEDTRMSMALNLLKNNLFTSDQIGKLIQAFSFEDRKLEFAKKAYNHCADKENYTLLMDNFSFNSSKEELMNFISK